MTQYDQGLGGYYEKFRFILVSICNLKNNFNLRDLFIFNVLDLNFLFIETVPLETNCICIFNEPPTLYSS